MAGQRGKGSEGPAPSAGALVRRGRQEIPWVADHELTTLEHREPATAAGLGLLCGGGGNLYVGDKKAGLAGVGAWIGAIVALNLLPAAVAALPLFVVMGWGAASAYLKARSVNSYIINQLHSSAAQSGHDPSHKLLAAMNPSAAAAPAPAQLAPPSPVTPNPDAPFGELVARLQTLSGLRASGMIDDTEHRSRKIDALSDAGAGLDSKETEALLFALIPLLDSGAVVQEDIDFIKDMGS